jgi:hypothetical protein
VPAKSSTRTPWLAGRGRPKSPHRQRATHDGMVLRVMIIAKLQLGNPERVREGGSVSFNLVNLHGAVAVTPPTPNTRPTFWLLCRLRAAGDASSSRDFAMAITDNGGCCCSQRPTWQTVKCGPEDSSHHCNPLCLAWTCSLVPEDVCPNLSPSSRIRKFSKPIRAEVCVSSGSSAIRYISERSSPT